MKKIMKEALKITILYLICLLIFYLYCVRIQQINKIDEKKELPITAQSNSLEK